MIEALINVLRPIHHLVSLGYRDSLGLPFSSDTWHENRLIIHED